MKIAIYYPWIYLKSGVERTILEYAKSSHHSITIFTNHYDKEATYPEFKKLDVIELENIPIQRNILSSLKAAVIIAFQKVDLSIFDALIVHSEGLGDLFLIRNTLKQTFCLCHTPLRPVFDIEYKKRALEQRSRFRKHVYAVFAYLFKILDRQLWKKYSYIIFNSRETLRRAKNGGLVSENTKFEIINPGVSWEKIKPTWKYEKYYLIPGRIMWTKNIELGIEAFKLFSRKRKDFKLIIAGMVDKKSEKYLKFLQELSSNSLNINFIINPSDNLMAKLYSNCFAVLATSFNEDWGLTPVEANAYGKAVIAVNRGGFKESQGNGKTGYLVNFNAKSIAVKMLELSRYTKRAKNMGIYAREYSKRFSWNKFNSRINQITETVN